ncbi:PREDICTED: pentatricopeptide repeat-containing protein 2, mitochondrial-like [Polistes dominula]|uniref:Pentatricopeptide repeat-containing protein 2, mitochondrial-like n=1 Tax=Polistes dominula TaxID=743375 RepID=A0ABM1JAN3_POLDO|nr:PREDICTED: pentatricopeptide repeat-containing protein 2, mitochondrial-like [Polistes dominula]
MATSLRLLRLNLPFMFNSTLRNTVSGTFSLGINRFIFTNKTIGMNNYEYVRTQVHQQFINVEDSFRQKMKEIVEDENSVVFTEDLKAMSHLVTSNPDDIDLFVKMIYKFNSQSSNLRFGNYSFGPVIMRAFNYVGKPDVALSTFLDPKLSSFFDQSTTYSVLVTLLYNNKMYSEVRQVFELFKSRCVDFQNIPRIPVIVNAAAAYQENTPESFNYLLNTWKELSQRNFPPMRRFITFLASLALKQDSPQITLELMSLIRTRYIDNRCLKILAYCRLNRLNDVAFILKNSLEGTYSVKETYFSDVIEEVEKHLDNANDELKSILTKIITLLREQGHVEEMTLEAHILSPMEYLFPKRSKNLINDRANENNRNEQFRQPQRKRIVGLKDLI